MPSNSLTCPTIASNLSTGLVSAQYTTDEQCELLNTQLPLLSPDSMPRVTERLIAVGPVTPSHDKQKMTDCGTRPGPSAIRIKQETYNAHREIWEKFQRRVEEDAPSRMSAPPQFITTQEIAQKAALHSNAMPVNVCAGRRPENNKLLRFGHDMNKIYSYKKSVAILSDITNTPVDVLLKKSGIASTDVGMSTLEVAALFTFVGRYYGQMKGRDGEFSKDIMKKYFASAVCGHPDLKKNIVLGMVQKTEEGAYISKLVLAEVWSEDGNIKYELFDSQYEKNENGDIVTKKVKLPSLSNMPLAITCWVYETDECQLHPRYWEKQGTAQPPAMDARPLVLSAYSLGAKNLERYDTLNKEPGAFVLSKWLDTFRVVEHINFHNDSKIGTRLVNILSSIDMDSGLRQQIYDLAAQAPDNPEEPYLPVLEKMEKVCAIIHRQSASYRVLGFLLKKTVAQLVAETGIASSNEKHSLTDIVKIYMTAKYPGEMLEFSCADDVMHYVTRAVQKVPALILKLALGYVTEDGVSDVVVIKAWMGRESGKQYRLIHVADDGSLAKNPYSSLSNLPLCRMFWLYETGKRYPISK
ncbi:hypothetical protein [Glaciimonas sp. GG7]